MHKLTVLTLLSLSLTTACMSEASWPHRDRAGFPMTTWQHRAMERDQRAFHYWEHAGYAPPTQQPPPPSYPTRPETARSAGADPVAQGVSGR